MSYTQPGDYDIIQLELRSYDGTTYDILDMFLAMRFVESIEENFIVGELVLNDGVGLRTSAPLIGEERIIVRYTVDGTETIQREFAVYQLGNITKQSATEISYTLFMISPEALTNANTKVSRSFRGVTPSDIVSNIAGQLETEKSVEIQDTLGNHNIVLPYWSPVKAINWAARWSITDSQPESWFVWFENKEGFHFVNVPSLYDNEPIAELQTSSNVDSEIGERQKGRDILSYDVISYNDKLRALQAGQYGTTTFEVDPVTKTYNQTSHHPSDAELAKLNTADPVSTEWSYTSADARRLSVPVTSLDDQSNISFRQTSPWQSIIESMANTIVMDATLIGFEALTAGAVIKITVPDFSSTKQNASDRRDRYITGNYLIHRAEHIFERNYRVITRLQTNSLKSKVQSDA